MINQTLTSLISGTIQLIGTFIVMISTNIWLTLITIVFIPIFTFGGGLIAKKSSKYYGYIEETVNGAKVIKVFNHEKTCTE